MEEKDEISAYGEMIVYQMEDEDVKLRVRLENETIWLTQMAMAELFQTTKQNISQHIRNVFDEGELDARPTVKKFLTVQREGSREIGRELEHYNLDVVISVGYRVKSLIATRFRIWATQILKEYVIKGFAMDDERLKSPPGPGVPDYFDEWLERIRDIRASEKRVYLRVREIFAMAADYAPGDKETAKFFSTIQNKLHYAATGMTAAEIIAGRADHSRQFMGLTSWKTDEPRRVDVTIAKNYLSENEIEELNRIVVMWLDFAEDQAKRRRQVFIRDWETRLDDFLRFNERDVLTNAGKIKKKAADDHALKEYEEFAAERRRFKELDAEKDYMNQLESAAKLLPKKGKSSHEG